MKNHVANDKSHGISMGWQAVKLIASATLLFASATKAWNVITILQGDGLLSTRGLLLIAIFWEAAVGIFLLVGDSRLAWRLTVGTFLVLAVAASYAIITGRSCNCISQQVSPHFMLGLDMLILVLAVFNRPGELAQSSLKRQSVAAILSVLVGLVGVAAAVGIEHGTDTADPLEFILADTLRAKPWPLNSSINERLGVLESGKWLVIIGRQDCDHCRELLNQYFADSEWHREGERTAFFLAGSDTWFYHIDRISFLNLGRNAIEWRAGQPFVASPAAFLLEDGIVVDAVDGRDCDEFLANIANNDR